jgi:hypothetical protein
MCCWVIRALFSLPNGVKRREAVWLLLRKFLRVFLEIFNIIIKKGTLIFKIVGIDSASVFIYIVQMRTILLTKKEAIIEN